MLIDFSCLRLLLEEEGRPTREISSVMMTTSGFLSPAREGKLPESRTPLAPLDTAPPVNIQPVQVEPLKKPTKIIRKIERKKDRSKELFRPDDKIKKQTIMKDIVKLKQQIKVSAAHPANGLIPNGILFNSDIRISQIPHNKILQTDIKLNKALVAARQKTEKLNTTIIPIPMKPILTLPQSVDNVDKLLTEPDKKKVNILKKISNVKNEKLESKVMKIKEEIKQESRESSPGLIIDENIDLPPRVPHISNDITIELVPCTPNNTVINDRIERSYFDESPPVTLSTPKTPELISSQSPPLTKEKRKRKDKSKVKKVQKLSPARIDSDTIEFILDRPKTPEAQIVMKQATAPVLNAGPQIPFPFVPNFGGPGLIPPPLYSNLAFPSLMHGFGQAPYMPSPHLSFMQTQPPRHEEIHTKVQEKPASPVNIPEEIPPPKVEKKVKEHKKEKKEKVKKKSKKDKIKNKAEKKKLKEEKRDKNKKEKKEKRLKDKVLMVRAAIELFVSFLQCLFIAARKRDVVSQTDT